MADSQRKTANLFDKSTWNGVTAQRGTIEAVTNGFKLTATSNDAYTNTYGSANPQCSYRVVEGETYTLSWEVDDTNISGVVYIFTGTTAGGTVLINTDASQKKASFTIPSGHNYVAFRLGVSTSGDSITYTNIMLNLGSSALPYEPYGWVHSLRKLGTATDIITTLPADLYADGNNATVGLQGNMAQTGTPTPQNPITPQETGERTGNLFDSSKPIQEIYVTDTAQRYGWIIGLPQGTYTVYTGSAKIFCKYKTASEYGTAYGTASPVTLTIPQNAYILIYVAATSDLEGYDIMLNTGSSPLPYEPYGYKLDIKSGNTTTPVYLGEVESIRKVYKYEFTGQESNIDINLLYSRFDVFLPNSKSDGVRLTSAYCSHYQVIDDGRAIGDVPNESLYSDVENSIRWFIKTTDYTTLSDFKAYLAAQYANGTPVTVWYVLATPTTGIVNEPLRKIGEYADTVSDITIPTITGADTFDVQTTLKPSEVELTYTGWHDATVKEWDGSEWQ